MAAAQAADLPPRYLPLPRAPMFVPFFSWTGLYLGINAGYGFGDTNWTNTLTGISTGDFNVDGFTGRRHARLQLADSARRSSASKATSTGATSRARPRPTASA